MVRRFCGLAALTLVHALGFAGAAEAQDLEAGKTPRQLFATTCVACHKGPQGLARGRSAGAVAGFLTQHYTTGKRSAGELAAYLVSVGGDAPKAARTEPQGTSEPRERRAARTDEAPEPKAARTAAEERRAKRAEQRAERLAAGKAAQAAGRPPGLSRVPLRARRSRGPQEPASVWSDPDPVVISSNPTPLVHERAMSRAQEARDPSLNRPGSRTAVARAQAPVVAPVVAPVTVASAPAAPAQARPAVRSAAPRPDGHPAELAALTLADAQRAALSGAPAASETSAEGAGASAATAPAAPLGPPPAEPFTAPIP